MKKTLLSFKAINHDGVNGITKIEDGIHVEVASVFKKDPSKTNPEELLAMAWVTCLNASLKHVLALNQLSNATKVNTVVDLVLDSDLKEYEFKLHAYVSIEHLSHDEILFYALLAHKRCPVSKLLDENQVSIHVSSYEDML